MATKRGHDVIPGGVLERFRRGVVIPAVPLALDGDRRFDEVHQRALVRYYLDAGAGGLAVGVHTTQFAIRDPEVGLFEPVLRYVAEVVDDWVERGAEPPIKIAGICGRTDQALREATFAREAGYHAGLVSLGAFTDADTIASMVAHCRAVAEGIPVVGFYLQPAVGGRLLPYAFWRAFAEIEGVIGVKIAPFNRYQTLDVVRGICQSGRSADIALYTGNDDHIVGDLLTPYEIATPSGQQRVRIVGGLLGHWAFWTRRAVELLSRIHSLVEAGEPVPIELPALGARTTDANAAVFDAAHSFRGCIPGIHEVLRRQGLLVGTWCLDPEEILSPGQIGEIDRVIAGYPDLNDDDFVRQNLPRWLAD
jgi:dihydrodipicolinate synthase/N-acetylneuraminate lyase